MKSFPWYVIHKDTKFVVSGFVEFSDAEKFCGMFSHNQYVVRGYFDLFA